MGGGGGGEGRGKLEGYNIIAREQTPVNREYVFISQTRSDLLSEFIMFVFTCKSAVHRRIQLILCVTCISIKLLSFFYPNYENFHILPYLCYE